ncbi:MAG: RNA methyltransferase [Henriciella sp.]|nr:RNA methyltransferase [Henriciella sp.]
MPSPILISDPADPRLAAYTSIRERDLTGRRDGRFIVEGKVTLKVLITRSRFEVESVLLADSRVAVLADDLATLLPHVPVYTAPQLVMDQVAGFAIHRGVLACAKKGTPTPLEAFTDAKTLLLLNDVSNHDNVGAAFRNAAAFGADGVLLDTRSCDPLYRKAIRVSAGTSLWLPFHHGGSGDVQIDTLTGAGFEVWAMTPRADAEPLPPGPRPDKLAILLGAEGPGLPDSLISKARAVRIPMRTDMDSLNVATAGAIALSRVYQG